MSVINRAATGITGSISIASHAPPPLLEVEFEGHRLTQRATQGPTLSVSVSDQLKHATCGAPATLCRRLDTLMNGLAAVSPPR